MGKSTENHSRLVLGTVQLGAQYGIANQTGQPDQREAYAILQTAWKAGVRTLDTAQAYGESEKIIGQFLKANPQCPFEVITKLAPDTDLMDSKAIRDALRSSRTRLGGAPVGLLLHNGPMLQAWNGPLEETLVDLKRRGEISELGVSVYEPDEFQLALSIPEITIIQAPFNAFDQRLLKTGLLRKAREQGQRVFLRSVFLQGLLALQAEAVPPQLAFAANTLRGWRDLLERFQLSPLMAALKFVMQSVPGMEIIIGCETRKQLQEIVSHVNGPGLNPDILSEISALPLAPTRLFNPSKWGVRPL